jgi:hypothetical protein
MMRKLVYLAITLKTLFIIGCGVNDNIQKAPELKSTDISRVITEMTDIMVHDITNPPLAARFFAYSCLSGYEIISQNDTAAVRMHGVLNGYPDIQKPDSIEGSSYQLAALLAIMETSQKMQPTGKKMKQYEEDFIDSCIKAGYSQQVLESSRKYAIAISKKILGYAKADKYNKISNLPRYTPLEGEGYWFPTPPAFMAAVEPEFRTVRPFALDSSSQFKPAPPVPFSKDKRSEFFKLMLINYQDTLPMEHRVIAAFWDCNPFAVQDNGHLMTSLKKISPGAHWLGITGIACLQAKKSFNETLQIMTMVSVGLMDSFLACWDEKFRSHRVRPETAIRKYIDPEWRPLLQTPPFPEYLSGHSCISSTSATLLTHYFGDNFKYTDSVEVSYGLPPRTFDSFQHAAEEAGISRLYGGIHFIDAIDNGRDQGQKVAKLLLQKLNK